MGNILQACIQEPSSRNIRLLFEQIDKDGSGNIDNSELKDFVKDFLVVMKIQKVRKTDSEYIQLIEDTFRKETQITFEIFEKGFKKIIENKSKTKDLTKEENLIKEANKYLKDFLLKQRKSKWDDLSMAGKTQAAFFVGKKILLGESKDCDDYKWKVTHDFFGYGVTLTLQKIHFLPTSFGEKQLANVTYVYFDKNGELDLNYSKLN